MIAPPTKPDSIAARRGREPLQIGDWTLDPQLGVLRRGQEERPLGGKALHVLLVLIDAGESAVSRNDLLKLVWGENYPADGVVSRAIADIRSALGESAGESNYIRTLPKFGYKLVANGAQAEAEPKLPISAWHIALALLVVAVAIIWIQRPNTEAGNSELRLPPARPLTSGSGLEHQPRVVPGGDWVVYAALRPGQSDWDLFRVSTKDGMSQTVAASPGVQEHGPAVSPTGEEVAYVRLSDNACYVVTQSINFGVPKNVATCTTKFATTVDWSSSGDLIAFTGFEGEDLDGYRRLYLVDLVSGDRRRLTDAVSPTGTDFYPRFSPSGSRVSFLRGEPQPDHRTTLWYVDTLGGAETRLTTQPAQLGGMVWIDDTTLLYSINEAGRFELRLLNVATGTARAVQAPEVIHPDYDANMGLLVAALRRSERDLVVITDESAVPLASSTSDDHHGVFSPDESLVAFISRRSGHDELWIVDTKDDVARRLTQFDGATVRYPAWHPAGRRVMFTAQTDAGERLYEVDIISGDLRQLGSAGVESTMPKWLPGGQRWVQGCKNESGWGICVADDSGTSRIADDFFRPTPVDDDTVSVVDRSGVLFELSLDDGAVELVWGGLPNDGRSGWAIDAQQVIYVAATADAGVGRVIRRDMNTRTETTVYEGPMPLIDTSIDIGARTGAVLFTRHQAASDDLTLFEHKFEVQ